MLNTTQKEDAIIEAAHEEVQYPVRRLQAIIERLDSLLCVAAKEMKVLQDRNKVLEDALNK